MAKIFLDVGAHIGESATVALDERYKFDKIHCFEPAKASYSKIKKNARIVIHKFGLFNKTCILPLYCAGSLGASVFKDKPTRRENFLDEQCNFIKASDWFSENVSANDYVVMKVNVEGAEIEIMDDLLDTGEYDKINHLMISFDVGKIKGKGHLENKLLSRLGKTGRNNYITQGAMKKLARMEGTKPTRKVVIGHWFDLIKIEDNG